MQTMRICPSCGSKDFQQTLSGGSTQTNQALNSINNLNQKGSGSLNSIFTPNTQNKIEPAPLMSRLFAFVIDWIIVAILQIIPITIAYMLTLPVRNQDFSPLMIIGILIAFVAPVTYHTIMPASNLKATYGKKLMGIKLITIQGEKLEKIQAFTRVILTMIVPIIGIFIAFLSIGGMAISFKADFESSALIAFILAMPIIFWGPYLTVYFNSSKQTLFDMIVKTIVVKG